MINSESVLKLAREKVQDFELNTEKYKDKIKILVDMEKCTALFIQNNFLIPLIKLTKKIELKQTVKKEEEIQNSFISKLKQHQDTIIVNIPDLNLKKSLNIALNRSVEEQVFTQYDMYHLPTELDLKSSDICDITGLEYAKYVENLNLANNKIVLLAALSNLNNLKILDISNNQVETLNQLAHLKNLTHLYGDHNNICNVNFFNNLSNLKVLDLRNNHISNVYEFYIQSSNVTLKLGNQMILLPKVQIYTNDVILDLNFLQNRDGSIPQINRNSFPYTIYENHTIIWKDIKISQDVKLEFTGNDTFSGTIILPIEVVGGSNSTIDTLSTGPIGKDQRANSLVVYVKNYNTYKVNLSLYVLDLTIHSEQPPQPTLVDIDADSTKGYVLDCSASVYEVIFNKVPKQVCIWVAARTEDTNESILTSNYLSATTFAHRNLFNITKII